MKILANLVTFLVFTHSLFLEVNSHPAPDLSDFIQEVVGRHLQDQGVGMLREWGMDAVRGSPLAKYFKATPAQETSSANPVEDAKSAANKQEIPDFDADPGKYISPLKLSAICGKSGSSSIWKIFHIEKENDKDGFAKMMCVPPVICGSHVFNSGQDPKNKNEDIQFCERELLDANKNGAKKTPVMGVCCPEESIFPGPNETILPKLTYLSNITSHTIKPISPRFNVILSEGTQKGMNIIKKLYLADEEWKQAGHFAPMSTILDDVLPESRDIGDGGLGLVEVTKAIAEKLTGSSALGKQVPAASVLGTFTAKMFCPIESRKNELSHSSFNDCSKADLKYRTINGSCNNMKQNILGQIFGPLIRLTHSAYQDGVFTPRVSSAQTKPALLPSARKIVASISLNDETKRPSTHLSFGFAQHGQFVAYDMSQIVNYDLGAEKKIKCCTNEGKHLNGTKDLHPLCLIIDVSEEDPFYSTAGVRCLPFVRSMISSKTCSLGAAQQMNQVTHWLDLSQVYGSLDRVSNFLREFKGGRLRAFENNRNSYLALDQSCNLATLEGKCGFRTGDLRTNQNLYLTMIQTLWRREHNRVANILTTYNPQWSDEELFQEARKITIAEYQHITFNEFVPAIIGPKYSKRFNLFPKFEGFTEYREEIDASVSNEHTTAAFRFGHSTIPDFLKIISDKKTVSTIEMRDAIEKPLRLIGDGVPDSVVRGMSRMSMGHVDEFASAQIAGHLYKPPTSLVGSDLFSINIQRGRDHGLPGYAQVVTSLSTYCGLTPIFSFKDFSSSGMINREKVKKLEEIYEHYEDVDLFVGGLMEEPVAGGIVGPTFGCIIGDQFSRSKFGDKFHYEHGGLHNSFTKDQLQQIRRASAARIYCDNSKEIHEMQPLALHRPSDVNPLIDCFNYDVIPKVDVSIWRNAVAQPSVIKNPN